MEVKKARLHMSRNYASFSDLAVPSKRRQYTSPAEEGCRFHHVHDRASRDHHMVVLTVNLRNFLTLFIYSRLLCSHHYKFSQAH